MQVTQKHESSVVTGLDETTGIESEVSMVISRRKNCMYTNIYKKVACIQVKKELHKVYKNAYMRYIKCLNEGHQLR